MHSYKDETDSDPGKHKIYGSNWIRIHNTGFRQIKIGDFAHANGKLYRRTVTDTDTNPQGF